MAIISQTGEASSRLGQSLARVVRYWACNMTLIHDRGQEWPGFGYDDPEKDTLRAIARRVDNGEFFVWLALVAGLFMAFAALIMLGGVLWASHVAANPSASAPSSDASDYVQLCAQMVVCLSVGFPLAMLVASWACGRCFSIPATALPDRATTLHFIDKLLYQITRIAVLGAFADLVLFLFVPGDSKVWLLVKLVMPILSPAVSVLALAYYASARLRRTAPR
jgi:hypothetical protein